MFVRRIVLTTWFLVAAGAATSGAAHAACVMDGTKKSVKSGNWSDPATWGGAVPAVTDSVNVGTGHTVNFDVPTARVAGVTVNCTGALVFDAAKSVTLESSKNVIVEGTIRMRPNTADQVHTLRFVGIVENNMVGGGMVPLDTDVGLWIMGPGAADFQGAKKTAWLRAAGDIPAGATKISLGAAPAGWRAGDEIAIAPTAAPKAGPLADLIEGNTGGCVSPNMYAFDEGVVAAVAGTEVTIGQATKVAHPKVANKYTAEVMNLTRNVRIEGTPGTQLAQGRSHMFIHSTAKQNVSYVQFRYMGPRKGAFLDRGDFRPGSIVLGRYALHFHHSMEGSRGAILEGNVTRDVGSHAFVPHMSHGITMRQSIAYNTLDIAYWWDEGEDSHHILWEDNVAAKVGPAFSMAAFLLGRGQGNIARRNVAVGVMVADPHGMAAFNWSANNEGIWIFDDNLAHNSGGGLNVWQNTGNPHDITRFDAYHNCVGIYHGAYGNPYRYQDLHLYGNGLALDVHAAPADGQQFHDIVVDGAGIADVNLLVTGSPGNAGDHPVQFRNVVSKGAKVAGVMNASHNIPDQGPTFYKNLDVIHSDIADGIKMGPVGPGGANPEKAWIRVQPKVGQSYRLNRVNGDVAAPESNARRTNIPAFAPTVWGKGPGMKVEYFDDPGFGKVIDTRREHTIQYDNWGTDGAHYAVGNDYSIRYTGKLMFQSTEPYRFHASVGGGFRCTFGGVTPKWFRIENDAELNSFQEPPGGAQVFYSSPVQGTAGQMVDFVCEYFTLDKKSSFILQWESATTGRQIIPQSQIYPPNGFVIGAPPPVVAPVNAAPVVNAGVDQEITLPINSVRLTGTAMDDDAVAKVQWVLKSGTLGAKFSAPTSLSTEVTDLVEGIYIFGLTATDNAGLNGMDEVRVTVKRAAPAPSPTPSMTPSPAPSPTPSVSPAPSCGRRLWDELRCGPVKRIRKVYVK